jgi:hypothetical protein
MRHLAKSFALCVDNTDYKASLIPGKVYRIIPDPQTKEPDPLISDPSFSESSCLESPRALIG